ncbi:MAG: D-aminoacyl-tRNA deacylase, partial [Desulfomicrobium sp.]|nr:D-aminoacyl-tRNA deacylase [Desulfomicrobium sp.]
LSLYRSFVDELRRQCPQVAEGEFGADMDVSLVNWGPVTIWLDSDEL